jgi:phosphopantetheine adenylyltransferase
VPGSAGEGARHASRNRRVVMGLLWEIVQSGFIYGQKRKADSIQDRVADLENHLQRTQDTIRELVKKIESIHGLDVDGDGRIG